MNIFKCAGCEARERENVFLREQVKRLQDTITEFADAGVAARLALKRGEIAARPEAVVRPVAWRGDRIQEPTIHSLPLSEQDARIRELGAHFEKERG